MMLFLLSSVGLTGAPFKISSSSIAVAWNATSVVMIVPFSRIIVTVIEEFHGFFLTEVGRVSVSCLLVELACSRFK